MLRFLLVVAIVVAAILLVRWILNEDPKKLARILRRSALWLVAGALIFMVVTGRAHWLFAVIGAAIPFFMRLLSMLRYVPLLSQLYTYFQNAQAAGAATAAGGTSHVEAKYVRMTLDHDSGDMDGVVLTGKFQARKLSELTLPQLLELLTQARTDDQDSAALLEAYIDRMHGDEWRSQDEAQPADAHVPSGKMSITEAREILGVSAEASRDDIVNAHRRLMQKLHPDRGGSDYLAAKINQAKSTLLDQL